MFEPLGRALGRFLEADKPRDQPFIAQDFTALTETIRQGDVLLVEGRARISSAIKYLTQSTWSHAALCVSDATQGGAPELVEVTLEDGCHRVALKKYALFHTRICRPVGLTRDECQALARFMVDHIGLQYDLRNVTDLLRYLLPNPPVPSRWRRQMLSLGSGDPTRAICSSLVAQAFQSLRYPILPHVKMLQSTSGARGPHPVFYTRDPSLFVPRDFDVSPYFAIVKPTLRPGFDFRTIPWAPEDQARGYPGPQGANYGPNTGVK